MAESYAQSKIGSLPDHKFLEYTKGSTENEALPNMSANGHPLKFIIEVYVNDYINLAVARSKRDLDHISNATIHGMHSVFPTNKVDNKDPICEKKMIEEDGQWWLEKDVLGWKFEGLKRTKISEEEKIESILTKLKE